MVCRDAVDRTRSGEMRGKIDGDQIQSLVMSGDTTIVEVLTSEHCGCSCMNVCSVTGSSKLTGCTGMLAPTELLSDSDENNDGDQIQSRGTIHRSFQWRHKYPVTT